MTHGSYIMNHCNLCYSSEVGRINPRAGGAVNNKGYTLVELALVVVIIGILAAVSIPSYIKYVNNTKTSRAMGEIRTLNNEINAYYIDNGKYPDNWSELRSRVLNDPWHRPYVYYNFAAVAPLPPAASGKLKDPLNISLNTDFDLYSLGPDGVTAEVGGVTATDDDIARSNDGVYVGLR
jgi:general secretion pathway protein G